jgi:hypothetical protein
VASWEDVRRLATALPEVTEQSGREGLVQWRVKDKNFVWERPLRAADRTALGDAAPEGPILGVRTADLDAKDKLLAEWSDSAFTTPHFDGYPAVLMRLERLTPADLEDIVTEAWISRAPVRLRKQFLETKE